MNDRRQGLWGRVFLRYYLILSVAGCLLFGLTACKERSQTETWRSKATNCAPPKLSHKIEVPAGSIEVGSNQHYPDERPALHVQLAAFDIDAYEVTNAQFAEFVRATGYQTRAERGLVEPEFADLPEEMRRPGSAVFIMPNPDKRASSMLSWWRFVEGANWRNPAGPASSIEGKEFQPVVHIAFEDALAYADWVGRALPSEDQWEYAARLGGAAADPKGNEIENANIWQGMFPFHNDKKDGFAALAPVGCFSANKIGAYDMIGNVWEWTQSPYWTRRDKKFIAGASSGHDPAQPGQPVNILKGGSYLCAENFCARYRPAARQQQDLMLGASHIGFRTVSPAAN